MKVDESGGYIGPGIAELYDCVPQYASRPDVDFYVSEAVASGGPVLELGCGTGRVLLAIARKGIDITGLDLAAPMLDVLRAKLAEEPEEVTKRAGVVHGDMTNFRLDRQFALVIIPFRPFQHVVEVSDQLRCLQSIRRHLRPTGRLVFDVFYPDFRKISELPVGEERARFDDGREFWRTDRVVAWDWANQVRQTELLWYVRYPDGRQERHVQAFPFRYFFRFELEHLLARAGFEVVELYGDFDRTPFGQRYPGEMIFVAAPVR